jgi:predicted O-methyltransferase YrrM
VLKRLVRRLPSPLYQLLYRVHRRLTRPSIERVGIQSLGPLVTAVAPRLETIPGWFHLDDMAHFSLVLGTQRASGVRGDILEIGCYFGRSAALLAMHLQPGEHLYLIDVFDLASDESYTAPSVATVRENLYRTVPTLAPDAVTLIRCDSRAVTLPADLQLRFVHIDGGHAAETVYADLKLCTPHLLIGGIVAIDDYAHPALPGVLQGVDQFLAETDGFTILADLNRAGAAGRKLYLSRVS